MKTKCEDWEREGVVLSNIWRSQKRWDWGFLCLSMGGATNGPFLGAL